MKSFSLTRFAVRYRTITYLLTVVLMLVGVYALQSLSRREDPKLSNRYAQIIALYPGATAEQVEELLTDRLERTIREVKEVGVVTSVSRPGISVLTIEAGDYARNLDKFTDDIRKRVDDLRPTLPRGVVRVVVNDRFADTAALIFGITYPAGTDRDREVLAKRLRDRLRKLPSVGEVNILGEQQENVTLDLSLPKLSQRGILPDQIAQAVAGANILSQTGGSVTSGSARLSIEPIGKIHKEQSLSGLVVARGLDGLPVYLRDVAGVRRGYADPSPYITRIGGQSAVAVVVVLRDGGNITQLGEQSKQEVAVFAKTLPSGASVQTVNDLPRSVQRRMGEFFENLISGVLLIVAVMYLFMGARAALIVGGLMPVTILGTFAFMLAFERDMQQMSIAALIIALGLVVDNSIVVIDNIEKKLSEGIDAETAAIVGTDELAVPLLTSNLTTVASFAPLVFISGATGEFIRDLGVVTGLATLVSLLLNYTLIPLVAIHFLRAGNTAKPNPVRRAFPVLWTCCATASRSWPCADCAVPPSPCCLP